MIKMLKTYNIILKIYRTFFFSTLINGYYLQIFKLISDRANVHAMRQKTWRMSIVGNGLLVGIVV